MPYCSSCGSYIESEKKFCGNCGAPNEKYDAGTSQGYQTQPQVTYYTPYQNTSFQPVNNVNDIEIQKKSKRSLAFSIVTFVLAMMAIFIESGFSIFGIMFFPPALVNTIQYKIRSGKKMPKLALIFTIIGGTVSTFMLIWFLNVTNNM